MTGDTERFTANWSRKPLVRNMGQLPHYRF